MGHDTPVSDQVGDNGTEHSGISVPGPGRLATGKIIKRRPSEVLRDEAVSKSNIGGRRAQNVPKTGTEFGHSRRLAATTSLAQNGTSLVRNPLGASSKLVMRIQFLFLLYDRPPSLRDLGL